ncbi:basic proline-rich protein-like [Pseudonaja textilis]|uniref:basic proline-rich protein-like n=1 Tax=Pseudonaja textilis TaxID=8673 RepID=UPI000EA93F05|nr:basic proline-rich protein-like [Pseudonaja textilis]
MLRGLETKPCDERLRAEGPRWRLPGKALLRRRLVRRGPNRLRGQRGAARKPPFARRREGQREELRRPEGPRPSGALRGRPSAAAEEAPAPRPPGGRRKPRRLRTPNRPPPQRAPSGQLGQRRASPAGEGARRRIGRGRRQYLPALPIWLLGRREPAKAAAPEREPREVHGVRGEPRSLALARRIFGRPALVAMRQAPPSPRRSVPGPQAPPAPVSQRRARQHRPRRPLLRGASAAPGAATAANGARPPPGAAWVPGGGGAGRARAGEAGRGRGARSAHPTPCSPGLLRDLPLGEGRAGLAAAPEAGGRWGGWKEGEAGVTARSVAGSAAPQPGRRETKVAADVGGGERRPRAGDTIKGATQRAQQEPSAHAARRLAARAPPRSRRAPRAAAPPGLAPVRLARPSPPPPGRPPAPCPHPPGPRRAGGSPRPLESGPPAVFASPARALLRPPA